MLQIVLSRSDFQSIPDPKFFPAHRSNCLLAIYFWGSTHTDKVITAKD